MLGNIVFNPIDLRTLRPDKLAIYKVSTCFRLLEVDKRLTYITLPKNVTPLRLYSLFKLYYSPKIVNSII